ncbi:MAG: SCO family protein [Xanthomonadaceae bacterium]|nr:SCO family protein [Xanthomonadaceae bacterium]
MNSRRTVVTALGLGLPAAALAAKSQVAEPGNPMLLQCERPAVGRHAKRFPQVLVQDQNGEKFWFYENLIQDKLVLLSFASIDGERQYPIVDNLLKVQEMLGERLGNDVFMYTITTKPEVDTAPGLREYATSKGARWQFLGGEPEAIHRILAAFSVMGSVHGLTWIGNQRTGRWLTKPARVQPIFIAEAVALLSTGKHHRARLLDMRSTMA